MTNDQARPFYCPILSAKHRTADILIDLSAKAVHASQKKKLNLIWLETNGCSGNIISLMNAKHPDLLYLLTQLVTLQYNNSLMAAEGDAAFLRFVNTLETEFILVVEGAIAQRDNGAYNIIANYKGKAVTGLEAVKMAGAKAKYILAVGTCASFGGISAAKPNPSQSVSLDTILPNQEIIKLPGCPGHPDWVTGTIASLLLFGRPELDEKNRPLMFYGITIHDRCPRRSYFDKGIFATHLGDIECMFQLGCKGPVTRTDCPIRRWNSTDNWPVQDNTPCIGCAQEGFPDGMEPFIKEPPQEERLDQ